MLDTGLSILADADLLLSLITTYVLDAGSKGPQTTSF